MSGAVASVHRSPHHGFSKHTVPSIRLLTGRGVEGDAHCGATVQHVYLKRRTPSAPNLMQVHLLQAEVLEELCVKPGELGENITTAGITLGQLPLGTRLALGATAVVELTGLRTPCKQIEQFRSGLLQQVTRKDVAGRKSSTAGVMAVVLADGVVFPADSIRIELPAVPHTRMTMI